MNRAQKSLDLHGLKYEDAVRKIELYLNMDWRNVDGELEIITGRGILRDYVLKRIKELNLNWRYHPLNNSGCIRIFE
jgi:dsDNA-specific endonuclease/ATPase MutS2